MSPETSSPPGCPRPHRWPWFLVLVLCSIGLSVALKLAFVHVQAHLDPNAKSFCAISERINCDTVARSPYAVFLGVPVAVWGIYGYLVIAGVGIGGFRSRQEQASAAALALLAAFSAGVSVTLGVISWLRISSLCILCLATYVINAILLGTATYLVRRGGWSRTLATAWADLREHLGSLAAVATLLTLLTAGLVTGYPRYWERSALAASAPGSAAPSSSGRGSAGKLATGVTPEGPPWIGAERPRVTIVEYSDYQCPFCNEAHAAMRKLLEARSDLRLVHRHFPLDDRCNPIIAEPFHPFACAYAALAVCAGEQGRFWPANDYLFAHGREMTPLQVEVFAKALGLKQAELQGCLEQRALGMLRSDIDEGVRLKVTGTPTFEVDGRVYLGKIPAEVLSGQAAGAQ